jgi:hypothetical protein
LRQPDVSERYIASIFGLKSKPGKKPAKAEDKLSPKHLLFPESRSVKTQKIDIFTIIA